MGSITIARYARQQTKYQISPEICRQEAKDSIAGASQAQQIMIEIHSKLQAYEDH